MWKVVEWGEEEKKLFIFQRKSCLNSSPALDAEKKLLEWKFSGKKAVALLHSVAVAVLRKNSKLNLHRVKLTYTAC